MKILITEDDLASRQILQLALISWGYEVLAVANGQAA